MAKSSYSASTPFANNGDIQGLKFQQPPKPAQPPKPQKEEKTPNANYEGVLSFMRGGAGNDELHVRNLMTINPLKLYNQIDRDYSEVEYSRDIKRIIENRDNEDFNEEYSDIYSRISFTGDFDFIPYVDVSNLREAVLPPEVLAYAKDVEFNLPYSEELCLRKGRSAEGILEAQETYRVPNRDDLLNFSLSNTNVLSNYDKNLLVINGIITGDPINYIRGKNEYPNSFADNDIKEVEDYDYEDLTDEEIKSRGLDADKFFNILNYYGDDEEIKQKNLELNTYLKETKDLEDLKPLLSQFIKQKPTINLEFNNNNNKTKEEKDNGDED